MTDRDPGGRKSREWQVEVRRRIANHAELVSRTRSLVAAGRRAEAEPDGDRSTAYAARRRRQMAPGAESFQGDVMETIVAAFLPEGAAVRRAVAYLEVNTPGGSSVGSGFLVSPDLLLTNSHVIEDAAEAHGAQAIFDKEADEFGRPRPQTSFLLDPGRFFLASPARDLDYALVALGQRLGGSVTPAELGFCALSDRDDKHRLGMNVNVIQHPRGGAKVAALRKNLLLARTARTLLYEADTDEGSSGSPVFNDDWDVVALHHWGQPYLETLDDQGRQINPKLNEGVRISRIHADLKARMAGLPAAWRALLEAALALDVQPAPPGPSRRLGPPRPGTFAPLPAPPAAAAPPPPIPPQGARTAPETRGESMSSAAEPGIIRITVPLEITIRIGDPAGAASPAPTGAAPQPAAQPRRLTGAAEALRRDTNYANRKGYDPDFIEGHSLTMPEPKGRIEEELAPLRPGEPDAATGELKYVHFSVKVNKVRRMAIVTATNIDGAEYLRVNRDTGRVENAAEGDTWFNDPRISGSFVLGQPFYSGWSHLFDRGHLTRRTDPTWGDAETAERANADTFHFPNCAPQHFRFNQSAKFWQGAERYVLENGVLAADVPKRLCVFQGPIFDDKVDLWADDVQIPSSFFKVIAWKGAAGLKAVGLVVDQKNLLSEERRPLGQPRDLPSIDISEWRVSISTIARRAGLVFDRALLDADTIRRPGQPQVGEEAQILLRSMSDLLPA